MSSTNRPVRAGLDSFYTPDTTARGCVRALGDIRGMRAWEPHAGGGAFVRALVQAEAGAVLATDVDERAPALRPGSGATFRGIRDARQGPRDEWGRIDLIVGNPPFNEAEIHVRRAVAEAPLVGMLLRLAFLEGEERASLWREHPPTEVHVFVTRPSFLELYEDGTVGRIRKRDKTTGNIVVNRKGKPKLAGADSAAYGWFVWRRGASRQPFRWLDWRGRA